MNRIPKNRRGLFPSTHWSLLEAVGGEATSAQQSALDKLAERYWLPTYAHVRSLGYERAQAEDLVQDFFASCLKRNLFGRAKAQKGRFRSYFLTSLNNHIKNSLRHEFAKRRRPSHGFADTELDTCPDSDTPATVFYRIFVADLIHQVLVDLEQYYISKNKESHIRIFHERLVLPALEGLKPTPIRELVRRYSINEKRIYNRLLATRRVYRRLLRDRIAEYAASSEDLDAELQELMAFLDRST